MYLIAKCINSLQHKLNALLNILLPIYSSIILCGYSHIGITQLPGRSFQILIFLSTVFFLNKSVHVHKITKATHALLQFSSQTVLYTAELVPRLFTHCLRRIRAFRSVYIIDTQSKKLSMGNSQEESMFCILSLLQIWLLTCK